MQGAADVGCGGNQASESPHEHPRHDAVVDAAAAPSGDNKDTSEAMPSGSGTDRQHVTEEQGRRGSGGEQEEEAGSAGASLIPVNGPTIVTADGCFTAWRVPPNLHRQLAASEPHLAELAVNNFWRHEVIKFRVIWGIASTCFWCTALFPPPILFLWDTADHNMAMTGLILAGCIDG